MTTTQRRPNTPAFGFFSEDEQRVLRQVNNVRDNRLPVSRFEDSEYTCLDFQQVINCKFALRSWRKFFWEELQEFQVLSIDFEGPDTRIPDVILLHPLGGRQYFLNIVEIEARMDSLEELLDELGFFFDVLCDSRFIKLGSGLKNDLKDLDVRFNLPETVSCEWVNVHDTSQLFIANKKDGLYDIGPNSKYANRTSLGVISYVTVGYDHKCYGQKQFPGTSAQWRAFDPERRLNRDLWMYQWDRRRLYPKQYLYCYLDTAVVLKFVVDSLFCGIQKRRIEIQGDETGPILFRKLFGHHFSHEYVEPYEPMALDEASASDVPKNTDDQSGEQSVSAGQKRKDPVSEPQEPTSREELMTVYAKKRGALAKESTLPEDLSTAYQKPDFKVSSKKGSTAKRDLRKKARMNKVQQTHYLFGAFTANPFLVPKDQCRSCGRSHSTLSIECDVARYHIGLPVRDLKLFQVWPCIACKSRIHTTPMCRQLHAFCETCLKRGHFSQAHEEGTEDELAKADQIFHEYSFLGVRTRKATHDHHKWGLSPDKQVQLETNGLQDSDVEVEEDEYFEIPKSK